LAHLHNQRLDIKHKISLEIVSSKIVLCFLGKSIFRNITFPMVRRKRDDDSSNVTFNSSSLVGVGAGTSGALRYQSSAGFAASALDWASTAAESQPSLGFDASSMSAAGSFGGGGDADGGPRPHKRRRKTLTDALQQINLNRDVPQQIVDGTNIGGGGVNSNSTGDLVDGDDSSLLVNRGTSSSGGRDVDDDDDDVASGLLLGLNGAEDYDDNSQLTASDEEDDGVQHHSAMTNGTQKTDSKQSNSVDMDAVDESDNDETDTSDNLDPMNAVQRAQRKVMLELLVGRKVNFAGKERPLGESSISAVDRKIEQLLRQSLQNVQQGAHPLEVTNVASTDDEYSSSWKSHDDMAIDSRSYHSDFGSTSIGGSRADQDNKDQTSGAMLPPTIRTRKRRNSCPQNMDLDTELELDGKYSNEKNWSNVSSPSPIAPKLPLPGYNMARNQSNAQNMLITTLMSDSAMD
jgi:hypothetical protein